MDTTVSGISAVVVAQLRAAGYMESTVGQYQKTIKALTVFASGREYSVGLGAEFASMTTSARTVGSARRAGLITGAWSRCSTPMCRPAGWTWRFVVVVAEVHDRKAATSLPLTPRGRPRWAGVVWHQRPARPTAGWCVAIWCSWKHAVSPRLTAPTAPVSWRFWNLCWDRWARSSLFWVVSDFRPFLTFTGRIDLVAALNLAGVKRFHAIIPVLDDADEELVVRACASGAVSARDAAITLLALSTGLY